MAALPEQAFAAPSPATFQDDEEALYWDPRYHSYFYAGVMTPPTGQLYDFTGAPITHTSDTHTWTIVELDQGEGPRGLPGISSSRPILVGRDALDRLKLPRQTRRITWARMGPEPRVAAMQGDAEKRQVPLCCRAPSIMCCAVIVVSMLFALFCFKAFIDEGQMSKGDGPTLAPDLTTEDGALATPFMQERVSLPSVPSEKLTTGIQGRFFSEFGNESASIANLLIRPPPPMDRSDGVPQV